MNYYNPKTDNYGFIHSIDNVIFRYYIKAFNMKRIAQDLISIRQKCGCDGWEKLDCPACSKYSWYQNIVHIGAIHIFFGKMTSFDRINHSWNVLPMLRLEVNPNKHSNTKEFISVMAWIRQNCTDGELVKYDYAIDVPYPLSSMRVYRSKKEAGLYKGTIYRGLRSKHGFMRMYDKAKEQNLDKVLTRIEHIVEVKKAPSFEKIIILQSTASSNTEGKLDTLNSVLVSLCLLLRAAGIDFEPCIAKLNYRRRKKLEPFLYGDVLTLEYDAEILKALLKNIYELFNADIDTPLNSNGFISIPDDEELPFE